MIRSWIVTDKIYGKWNRDSVGISFVRIGYALVYDWKIESGTRQIRSSYRKPKSVKVCPKK